MTTPFIIRLHANDDVVIACQQLLPGTLIAAETLTVREPIPGGHKLAAHDIRAGETVRRYNQAIGVARTVHHLQHGLRKGVSSCLLALGARQPFEEFIVGDDTGLVGVKARFTHSPGQRPQTRQRAPPPPAPGSAALRPA